MNNSIKKKFSKDIEDQLNGFEQLLENYLNEEEKKELDRIKKETKIENFHYELVDYLEIENSRLTKIENFLSKKISIKLHFPQDERLLLIQKEKKNQTKEKVLDQLLTFDSALILNISQMFNSHFS